MATYVVQVVQRSDDGSRSVRVASRWPFAAGSLDEVKAFVDATPPYSGWGNANAFEILNNEVELLATRPFASGDQGANWS